MTKFAVSSKPRLMTSQIWLFLLVLYVTTDNKLIDNGTEINLSLKAPMGHMCHFPTTLIFNRQNPRPIIIIEYNVTL